MSNDTRRAWTKTDSEDAARLLAGMVERAKNRPILAERARRFSNPANVPCAGEKAAGESAQEMQRIRSPAAVAVTQGDGLGGVGQRNGREIAEGDGRVSSEVSRLRNANDNRPSNREDAADDRSRCYTLPAV